MKVRKVFGGTVLTVSLLLTFGVFSASADVLGLLDDVWFELKVEFSGKQYNVATEQLSDKNLKLTAYLHTTSDDGGYATELYTKNADGAWEQTGANSLGISVSGPNEEYLILGDNDFGDWRKKSKVIQIYQTSIINITTKSSGAFKSATFESLGAEVPSGQNDSGTKEYYGGAMVTGESIKVKNLPFGGVLYFSQDSMPDGLYRLDLFTGEATAVGLTGVNNTTVGLAYNPKNDLLYGSQPFSLLHIQRDGSGSVNVGGQTTEGLAYDPVRNVLYGAINGTFFSMKKGDGSLKINLAAPGFDAEGLAVDPSTGVVYAIGNSTLLNRYDPDTNTWTTVGDTTINWFLGGLAYNPGLHMLYACGPDTSLYTIDPDTAAATVIGDSGVNLQGGLAFAPGVAPLD